MTKAADVYSFAMLMHELLTGQQLFEGMRQSQVGPSIQSRINCCLLRLLPLQSDTCRAALQVPGSEQEHTPACSDKRRCMLVALVLQRHRAVM